MSSIIATISRSPSDVVGHSSHNILYRRRIDSISLETVDAFVSCSFKSLIKGYKGSIPFGLASMSTLNQLEPVLKHLGIYDKLRVILSRDSITHHKPHPEIYLKAAEKLKI